MRRAAPFIHHELRGPSDAPTLVMLRGLGRSLEHWLDLPGLLERDFRLVLVDHRGIGRSDAAPVALTTAMMADDVALVLDRAGVDRCHLFGMSLGGMVAQRFALRHAHRLDRLVLGCTTAGGVGAQRIEVGTVLAMLAASIRPRRQALRRSAEITLSRTFVERSPHVVDRWVAIDAASPLPRSTLLAQALAGARHDAWAELASITAPTLVLCGDADRLIPPANSRRIAERIPGARLGWLAAAGHDFATEQPEATAEYLRSFLLGEGDGEVGP